MCMHKCKCIALMEGLSFYKRNIFSNSVFLPFCDRKTYTFVPMKDRLHGHTLDDWHNRMQLSQRIPGADAASTLYAHHLRRCCLLSSFRITILKQKPLGQLLKCANLMLISKSAVWSVNKNCICMYIYSKYNFTDTYIYTPHNFIIFVGFTEICMYVCTYFL